MFAVLLTRVNHKRQRARASEVLIMAKEIDAPVAGSYRTWLCNVALLALVCVAFVAGLLLGPSVLSGGWSVEDTASSSHRERIVHHKATDDQSERPASCISPKDLSVILRNWSVSLEDVIEKKLVNVSKWKINQATRKLSKAKDTSTKKTIKGTVLLNALRLLSLKIL